MSLAAPAIEPTVEPSGEGLDQDALEAIAALLVDFEDMEENQPH